MSDVITYLAGISDAAKQATNDLGALMTAEETAANAGGGGGGGGSEKTGGKGGGSGLDWLGSSVTAAGSLDAGKIMGALKGLGGR